MSPLTRREKIFSKSEAWLSRAFTQLGVALAALAAIAEVKTTSIRPLGSVRIALAPLTPKRASFLIVSLARVLRRAGVGRIPTLFSVIRAIGLGVRGVALAGGGFLVVIIAQVCFWGC